MPDLPVAPIGHPPAAEFFNDQGLVAARLGEYVKGLGHLRIGIDGRLYRYAHGLYCADGEVFVKHTVREVLGERCKGRHFSEVLAWIGADYPSITDALPEQWLNLRNGLLDWRTGELSPHSADVVSTVQVPVPWRPDAACPRIDAFLADVLPADAIELVHELAGYALYPATPLRRAVLLLGSGQNGKSVLLAVLKALIGTDNISTVPLQQLAESRFAAAELFGKLANIAGDLDARAIRQTDVFKTATGGDPIMAERKYGHAFSFTPYATFLFAANEAPISSDQTDGWFDRWIILPFDRRIPDRQVDPELPAKLTAPDELAGFLNRAISGLRCLMTRGRFDLPPSIRGANDAYRDRLDTVRGFVGESCVLRPDAWVPRRSLYEDYRNWATRSGRLPVSSHNFYEHLRKLSPSITDRKRNGTEGFIGIGLSATEGLMS